MMTNKDFIESYKSDDRIITDYYKLVKNGKTYDIADIVNPLAIDNR
jgi:hypothetical protein